ncbi:MAG: TolC family protein [Chitinophagaceae bacterium]|nr:TolC family protein [Chitinophagaceae bacterium]MCA6512388.1 TolC family protein [Chitinophagaceae bacterium]
MIRFLKIPLIALSTLLTVQPAFAQTTPKSARYAFSIEDALTFAKNNNIQVKNALLAVQMQKETNREITSGALPSVSFNGNLMDYLQLPVSLIPGEIFGGTPGTFIPVQFGTKYNSTLGFQLQQTLFDGQVFIGLQARKTSVDFQLKNLEVTEELIKANIYKVYYQLVASRTQIAILDANIVRLQQLEKDTKTLYQNGFAEKLDQDKVSIQLTNLQTEKLKAQNSIEIGYLGLKTLIGMRPQDTLELTDKITESQLEGDILSDTAFRYEDRKDFQYLELAKKLNEFNIRRYQLSYLPTLNLTGGYNKNAQRRTFDFFAKGGDWFTTSFLGLNLSFQLFNGFARDARLAKSRIELRQTNFQIDNLKKTIDTEIEQARLNFITAQSTLKFQKKNMELAEKVYSQTRKKYEVGTGSSIEISAAQTDLITAQNNYMAALYGAIVARVDYRKATGKL